MEKDKYYVPDIEDFRIGYKFEFQGIPKGWHKMTFSEENSLKNMRYNIEKLKDAVRVPYLSQEQIENEGWIYTPDFNHYYKNIDNEKGYGIDFFEDYMIISDCGEPIFRGIIKSINEFRYICKLLKI